jgi:hypothetical protein
MSIAMFAAACGLAVATVLPAEQPDRDRAAVLAVVQRLFDAMAAHDAAALSAVLLPGGQLQSVREEKGCPGAWPP